MSQSLSFRCPNCGAPLEVTPGRTDVKCTQCGTVTNLSQLLARMEPANLPPPDNSPQPLSWLIFGNQVGWCGCIAAVIFIIAFLAIVFFLSHGAR